MISGMQHQDWRVRKWCVAWMDHNADESCLLALAQRMTDSHADVRRHAVHSIGCQSCKDNPLCLDIVSLLIDRAINDNSVRVRRCAVHMLGNQSYDRRAVTILQTILDTEKDR